MNISVKEWNANKRWNPFNSYKLLAQVERWKHIKRGDPVPAPALITVDPANYCNHNCLWCNAEEVRRKRKGMLSERVLSDLADYLPNWGKGQSWRPGVESVCVAGGGEPLSNRATSLFIDKAVKNGVDIGVVTNGTFIDRHREALAKSVWVGVSVDAATQALYNKLKNIRNGGNDFNRVITNIHDLVEYSRQHKTMLGMNRPGYGVSYKFLLYKDNIGEIYEAAKLAKEIGCSNIHFRPASTTWINLRTADEIVFTKDEVALFSEQIEKALALDCQDFGVYGITHKFDSQFCRNNDFLECYSIFMTAVVMPPYGEFVNNDLFTIGLCCDRRGDSALELASNIADVGLIDELWGRERHWEIHDNINVALECPRCTYQPHNQIYEQVIQLDSMTYKFI